MFICILILDVCFQCVYIHTHVYKLCEQFREHVSPAPAITKLPWKQLIDILYICNDILAGFQKYADKYGISFPIFKFPAKQSGDTIKSLVAYAVHKPIIDR